jgi:single-strand DNA-binding protein
MNNITVIGRITKDAETRTVKIKGVDTLVTDFTVAANEGYGENQTTEYFRVAIWRDRGAKMKPGLVKGRIIAVKGAVSAHGWLNQEGKAQAQLEIKNPSVQFIDKRPGDPEEAPEVGNEDDKPF